jgi:hypothetical protein
MPSKLLRVRSATVAGLVLLSIGGVAAAATGRAPAAAERAATPERSVPDTPGKGAHARGEAATVTLPDGAEAGAGGKGSGSGKPADHAGGPDAAGPARRGLCQDWLAGQGDVQGRRADAPAFQALAVAAGGADQVAAYCEADSDASAKREQRPVAPPTTTGQREDPGRGHGKGGPPRTS